MSSCNEEECFTFTWKIENISLLRFKGTILSSPAWETETTNGKERWYLDIIYNCHLGIFIAVKTLVTELKPHRCIMSLLTDGDEVPLQRLHNRAFVVYKSTMSDDSRQSILPDDTLTVCYKMWDDTLKAGQFRVSSVLHELNYLWDIENFNPLLMYSNKITEKENLPFYMILDKRNKENTHTFIFGSLYNRENSLSLSYCAVSINDDIDRVAYATYATLNSSHGRTSRWAIDIIIKNMNENLKLELESIFLVHANSENAIDSPSTLDAVLQHLYKDGLCNDVTIQTEGKSFSAHKNILTARSPVFRAMFEKDGMREARSGVVGIDDVDSETMDRMLVFLYSDSLTGVHWKAALSLYYAADKYAVLPLKEKCADILKAGLSVDNACDLLVLTDAHSDQELMEYVMHFIIDHQEVVSLPRWEELEKNNPLLTSKISRELFLICKRKK